MSKQWRVCGLRVVWCDVDLYRTWCCVPGLRTGVAYRLNVNDLRSLSYAQVAELMPLASNSATLSMEYDRNLPNLINLDQSRIRQVVASALSNSIKVRALVELVCAGGGRLKLSSSVGRVMSIFTVCCKLC